MMKHAMNIILTPGSIALGLGLMLTTLSQAAQWSSEQNLGGYFLSKPAVAQIPRTAAANAPVRTVFVIGPDKKIKLTLSYPMSTGRNFHEILRVLDSIQLTAKYQVCTPADWKPGDDVIISGSVSDKEARKKYPGGWKAPWPYLRIVLQPSEKTAHEGAA